jgi:hypothetical protein
MITLRLEWGNKWPNSIMMMMNIIISTKIKLF